MGYCESPSVRPAHRCKQGPKSDSGGLVGPVSGRIAVAPFVGWGALPSCPGMQCWCTVLYFCQRGSVSSLVWVPDGARVKLS